MESVLGDYRDMYALARINDTQALETAFQFIEMISQDKSANKESGLQHLRRYIGQMANRTTTLLPPDGTAPPYNPFRNAIRFAEPLQNYKMYEDIAEILMNASNEKILEALTGENFAARRFNADEIIEISNKAKSADVVREATTDDNFKKYEEAGLDKRSIIRLICDTETVEGLRTKLATVEKMKQPYNEWSILRASLSLTPPLDHAQNPADVRAGPGVEPGKK